MCIPTKEANKEMDGERPSVSKFNLYVTFIIPAQKWYGQNNIGFITLTGVDTDDYSANILHCTFVV